MNAGQWFMLVQIVGCLGGAVGFFINKQPYLSSVWVFYALANIGFFFIAGGKA